MYQITLRSHFTKMEAFIPVQRINVEMISEGSTMIARHVCVKCKGVNTVHRTIDDHEKPFEDAGKMCGGTARVWTCVRCKECGHKARQVGYDFTTKRTKESVCI